MADIFNDLGMLAEMISPIFPELFLLFACIGSIFKSITGVAGGCTKAALTQHFAIRENLADVSAKDGSQETAIGLTGILLGMITTALISNPIVTWLAFVIFTFLHLFCNYQAVTSICLHTLNRQRAAIIITHFSTDESILSPDIVSKKFEKIFDFVWLKKINDTFTIDYANNIKIALPIVQLLDCDVNAVEKILDKYKRESYILTVDGKLISIFLSEHAQPKDILKSYFQAIYILENRKNRELDRFYEHGEMDSYTFTDKYFDEFYEKLTQTGWATHLMFFGSVKYQYNLK